jgi:hypothetical protein
VGGGFFLRRIVLFSLLSLVISLVILLLPQEQCEGPMITKHPGEIHQSSLRATQTLCYPDCTKYAHWWTVCALNKRVCADASHRQSANPSVTWKSQTAHSAQRTAHSAQRTAHSVQRTAHSAQRVCTHHTPHATPKLAWRETQGFDGAVCRGRSVATVIYETSSRQGTSVTGGNRSSCGSIA